VGRRKKGGSETSRTRRVCSGGAIGATEGKKRKRGNGLRRRESRELDRSSKVGEDTGAIFGGKKKRRGPGTQGFSG